MENSKRPISDIDQVTAKETSLDPKVQNNSVLSGSPPSIANARPDLNSPVTDRQRVPNIDEGGEDLVATGAGTLGGAAVGATLGLVGGPPGALVGGVIGGVMGVLQVMILLTPKLLMTQRCTGERNIKARRIIRKAKKIILI